MLSREYPDLYYDGGWQAPDSKERFDVISPSTGEKIGYVAAANDTDIDRAVEAARKAFYETDWPTRPVEERAEMMERLAALIAEHQPEFRDLIVDELGHNKLTAEVYHSVAPTLHWNYYAKVGREHTFAEVREADLSPLAGNAGGLIMKYETKSLLVREPVGVVAALCAFNFPLAGIAQKTAPAIVAGCTVVVKTPDPDPLSLFAMADLVTEAGFPPGVINIVAATRDASAHLVAHPDVDMVTFTGSTEVGKKIGEVCGCAGQALRARARRQVGGDHPRRRRPRDRGADGRRARCRDDPGRELHLHEPDPGAEIAVRRDRGKGHRGVQEPQGGRSARGRHGRRPAGHRGAPRARAGIHQDGRRGGSHGGVRRRRPRAHGRRAGTSSRRC